MLYLDCRALITVTPFFPPPLEKYVAYLTGIWERVRVSKNGPQLFELELANRQYRDVNTSLLPNNIAGQQLLTWALGLSGDSIPPSYVATSSAILWKRNMENEAARVLCLPFYPQLGVEVLQRITHLVREVLMAEEPATH
jgi:hypothetical protein